MNVIKKDKNEASIEIENLTLIELLRVYLNKDSSVEFAAWRRDHPSENPILNFITKGKTPKKAMDDALKNIEKDLDKVLGDFNKLKL